MHHPQPAHRRGAGRGRRDPRAGAARRRPRARRRHPRRPRGGLHGGEGRPRAVSEEQHQHGGGWREGDDPGRRRFVDVGTLALESGDRLPDVRVAYETWGTLSPARDNAVLVLHALTGDSHVTGPAGPGHPTPGWWEGLVGPGAAIDTDRWFVVAPNVLGGCQGTTGPSSAAPDGRPWGSRFPYLTVRDQVAAEVVLADALGIGTWAAGRRRVDGRDARAGVGGHRAGARRAAGRPGGDGRGERRPDRLVLAPARRDPQRPGLPRRRLPRRRRRSRPGGRARRRPPDRARHLPQRCRARPAVRPQRAARRPRRGPRRALRRRVVPASTTAASWPAGSTPGPTSSSPRR